MEQADMEETEATEIARSFKGARDVQHSSHPP